MGKTPKNNSTGATSATNGSGSSSSSRSNLLTSNNSGNGCLKVKRTRKSVPRDAPMQRSSIYRGVTRHRWTGRFEAHLWDKNCWNESQNKKGRQVYLGAYDDEATAAHAYDLAALKYWGQDTILNFPLSTYQEELKDMEGLSREEYIGSLRRKSSGFSRGVSKYRGVARHHHNGRWEARIGRVFGNKYLYLGTYATQEEAATAYDMAAIEYRGLNAVTNFDLSRYIKWLRPPTTANTDRNPDPLVINQVDNHMAHEMGPNLHHYQQQHNPDVSISASAAAAAAAPQPRVGNGVCASSALGTLLQSSKFKEMLEKTSSTSEDSTITQLDLSSSDLQPTSKCSFPDDIQTYFECNDGENYTDADDIIFKDLSEFTTSIFNCELD